MILTRNELSAMFNAGKIFEINFTKTNGEKRYMLCTLHKDIIPPAPPKPADYVPRPVNPNTFPVWDIEAEAFRSFRVDSLLDITEVKSV